MASPMRLLALAAVAGMAMAASGPAAAMHHAALDRRQSASQSGPDTSTVTTSAYTPYYAALATGYTTDPASAATSTTTANQPCVTQPEAGTYCGFINPEDACAPQPDGYGPVPTPDTASAFLNFPTLHSLAQAAPTTVPSSNGHSSYTQVFKDLNASISGDGYLLMYDLKTYDVAQCASLCDATTSCISFNIFAERDPSLRPSANDTTGPTVWGTWCPKPPSMTTFRCALWAKVINASQATNYGSWEEQFHIVITASDGYTKVNGTTSTSSSASSSVSSSIGSSVSSSIASSVSSRVSSSIASSVSSTVASSIASSASSSVASSASSSASSTVASSTSSSGSSSVAPSTSSSASSSVAPSTSSSTSSSAASSTSSITSSLVSSSSLPTTSTSSTLSIVTVSSSSSVVVTTSTTTSTSTTSAAPTCPTCTPDSFTDAKGNTYDVSCNMEFWGDDLTHVAASCYSDCFDICDNTSQCNAFAWDPTAEGGPHCWLKSIPSSSTEQPYPLPGIVFGRMPPPPVCPACTPGSFTDAKGNIYDVSCDMDFWGDDLTHVAASCYSDCFDICDNTAQCDAFAWDPTAEGGPHCWLKSIPYGSTQKPTPWQGIVFGQKPPTCPACSSGEITDNNGKQYTITCGNDIWGYDLGAVPATCYEDCFDICDKNSDCNAFVFNPFAGGRHCWPKRLPPGAISVPSVVEGVVFGQIPSSGSSWGSNPQPSPSRGPGPQPSPSQGSGQNSGWGSNQNSGSGSNQNSGWGSNQNSGSGSNQNSGWGSNQNSGSGSNQNSGWGSTQW